MAPWTTDRIVAEAVPVLKRQLAAGGLPLIARTLPQAARKAAIGQCDHLLRLAERAERAGNIEAWDALCHLLTYLNPAEADTDPHYRAAWLAALTGEE